MYNTPGASGSSGGGGMGFSPPSRQGGFAPGASSPGMSSTLRPGQAGGFPSGPSQDLMIGPGGDSARFSYEEQRARRLQLEAELERLEAECAHGDEVLAEQAREIEALRGRIERQRAQKPSGGCRACSAVPVQVAAATQSLLGAAAQLARALLENPDADRGPLLAMMLRYVEPVKHLDPALEDLYARAKAVL
eukprot:gnl/MRDRNA2_/MRDRNA2_46268_c0_seq1.p1 gnl/MRDRNA2_/MRDRNA2_46268_c0~~gnl/MRDRNA2_/MRDRNA2_46268_c0_seq1.p1  ORF type:complete len:192 (-),score=46.37 gnl/MRDRNA2_/MRDRNA2_46268_c0_seq1:67-642(-)